MSEEGITVNPNVYYWHEEHYIAWLVDYKHPKTEANDNVRTEYLAELNAMSAENIKALFCAARVEEDDHLSLKVRDVKLNEETKSLIEKEAKLEVKSFIYHHFRVIKKFINGDKFDEDEPIQTDFHKKQLEFSDRQLYKAAWQQYHIIYQRAAKDGIISLFAIIDISKIMLSIIEMVHDFVYSSSREVLLEDKGNVIKGVGLIQKKLRKLNISTTECMAILHSKDYIADLQQAVIDYQREMISVPNAKHLKNFIEARQAKNELLYPNINHISVKNGLCVQDQDGEPKTLSYKRYINLVSEIVQTLK